MKKAVSSFLVALMIMAGSACVAIDIKENETLSVDRANDYFARGRYSQASLIYRKAVEEKPDSPHRKATLLGLADSLYLDEEYFEATLYYERFIELYPLDPLTPRAAFYLAMCSYSNSFIAERDQTNSGKAIDTFKVFIDFYPNSPLTPTAKRFKREMENKLTESEMKIARFYHRVDRNTSAVRRLQEYLEKHPKSGNAPEALYLLGDCFYREGAEEKAATIFSIIMEKYPESEFARLAAQKAETILSGKRG